MQRNTWCEGMEEAKSNVDEGRLQTAPFLKTCDNE